MAQIAITATKRTVTGKRVSKLRKAGNLPAVLYGHNVENQQIEINDRDFSKALKTAGESTIVNLVVDGKPQPVLIHDVQHHYLTEAPIHVDFFAVNMTEKLKVNVPLHFIGESMAVKSMGGTLVKNLSEVEVECLPADLPHAIEVDITGITNFEEVIRLSDLKVVGKVEVLGNPQELVVSVVPPRSEAEMSALDEAIKEDVTAVEGVVKPEETIEASGDDAKSRTAGSASGGKEEKPAKGESVSGGKEEKPA